MLVMAKVFCTISMAILRIYTAELLPTALRGSGLGVITGVSYFGANVMPFMLKLVSFNCLDLKTWNSFFKQFKYLVRNASFSNRQLVYFLI